MRSEAIAGTNLFGYSDRRNSEIEDKTLSDKAENSKNSDLPGSDVLQKGINNQSANRRQGANSASNDVPTQQASRPAIGSKDRMQNARSGKEPPSTEDKDVKKKGKLVETPAFGTKMRGFFKESALKS